MFKPLSGIQFKLDSRSQDFAWFYGGAQFTRRFYRLIGSDAWDAFLEHVQQRFVGAWK